jgi:hypothetical protein
LICAAFSPIVVFKYHITNLAEEPCGVNAPGLQMNPLFTPRMGAGFDPEQGIRASMREHAESGGAA